MRLCEYFVKLKVKTPNTRKYKHTYTYIYIYIYINTRFQKRCNLKIYIKYIWVPELNYPWWNSFAHCTPWLVYKLVRLYPSSRRAGPRSLLALRHVRFSARARGNVCGKGMALLMSLDPLASPVLFVCLFFFFHHSLILTLSWAKKRPCRSADIDGPLASFCQSINQSEEGLNSNRDLIVRVFQSLIMAITFSSHKPCNVYIL